MLRNFLYLDAELTLEFVGQLEGGVSLTEKVTSHEAGDKALKASAGLGPVGVSAGLGQRTNEERERTIDQTPASLFDSLFTALDNAGQVQYLSALDQAIWNQLRRGEVVDIEANVTLAGLTKLFDLAGKLRQLAQVGSMFGTSFDGDSLKSVEQVDDLGSLMRGEWVPVIASVIGAPKYRFLARLNRSKLSVPETELEGEAVVFGKIQRILRQREELPAAEVLPGWSALPRDKRRELEASLKQTDVAKLGLGDLTIRAPGAVLMPVAIYR